MKWWLFYCRTLLTGISIIAILLSGSLRAQQDSSSVPLVVRYSGLLAKGQYTSTTAQVALALFREEQGGSPLWSEVQSVTTDAAGRFTVLLGSTTREGLPVEIFSTNEARWLSIRVLGDTESEPPRVAIVSVPYALKARDAETLGGHTLKKFVLQDDLGLKLAELQAPQARKEPLAGEGTAAAAAFEVQGATFTDPTPTNNYKWLELTPWQASSPKYNGTFSNFPQPGDPTLDNWSMRLGYNIGYGGFLEDPSKPAIALEWESNYSPYAGQNVQEFHLAHVSTSGFIQRPITFYRPTIGSDSLGLNNSVLQLGDAAANIKAFFGQAGRFDWYMSPYAPDNERIYFLRTNRNSSLGTSGSGGFTSLSFQKAPSNDYWQIGNAFTISHATGNAGIGSAPVPFVRMNVPPSSTVNGLDINGTVPPPSFFLRAMVGSQERFKVDAAGNMTSVGTVSSTLGFVGNLTGTASKASALAADPADCPTGQFAITISANGNLTCTAPGSTTQVLFNGSSTIAGDSKFTWNNISKSLQVGTMTGAYSTPELFGNITGAGDLVVGSLNQMSATKVAGVYAQVQDNTANDLRGLWVITSATGSSARGTVNGVDYGTVLKGSGAITNGRAAYYSASTFPGTGAISKFWGGEFDLYTAAGNTITDVFILGSERTPCLGAGMGCVNQRGLYLPDITGAQNNWAVYTNRGKWWIGDRVTMAPIDASANTVLILNPAAGHTGKLLSAQVNSVEKVNIDKDGNVTGAGFIGPLTGNASTASALAANPTDCSNGFAVAIDAQANLSCAGIDSDDVPDLSGKYVDLTTSQTIAGQKTFAGPVTTGSLATGKSYSAQQMISFSPAPTFDAGTGNNFKLTLTGNVTSSLATNASAGQTLVFLICQDVVGGWTFTWPSNFKGGMTVGAQPAKCSIQQFYFDGSDFYGLGPGMLNQ